MIGCSVLPSLIIIGGEACLLFIIGKAAAVDSARFTI